VAGCLNNLGNLARLRHDERAAEDFHRRALAIREALAPDSLDVAASLQNLAEVSRDRGDWRAAEPLYRRALAIKKKRAPDSLTFAATLLGLAESAAIREDLAGSLDLHQQALAIRSRLAPGSTAESDSLFAVGSCLRRLGRPQQAVERLRLSIAALEAQRVRLGSTGLGQSGFALLAAGAYEELIDLLVELDRIEEAFAVLERSRARGLLALLAERDIAFAADVPAPLEAEQRRDDAEYDRALDRLGQKSDPREIAGLRLQLAELRDRQLQIAARIRQASPRLAALQFPEPLDLAGVQAALDPGTLLLSYAVGKQRAFLFVVTARGTGSAAAAGLKAVRIPLGEDALRDRVLAFRALVDRGKQGAASDPALLTQGARLYDLLLRPAEAWIDGAQRILIVPGGPLAALPFAALVQSSEPRRYVAEWKPLHTIASATVYAEILKDRRSWSGASPTLVAFADPERPPRVGLAGSDALVARADALGSLPYARLEVQQIAELFGDAALTYLGAAATEERASSLGQGPRYIHFACHAVLDPRFPLESALVLSRPARVSTPLGDNGLLQAWEIFARVRIDADLVTLSACETALGGERAAEGLLGLSRAFQYAGAHSVLASLWELSDRSTPSLMQSFYRGLRQGLPKDEALQAAELQAIRAGAPPFEWAAFELSGDWK
jgi:CHAT domain-containing protein